MSATDWPPVTFLILFYNQRELVADALASADAQDYPDLEILLSDDCSTDGTWEALQVAASDYTGPHRLRLNRTDRNRHIGGHLSHAVEAASGDLIVVAAGDDRSEPHRTRRLVEEWLATDRRAGVLHSACLRVSRDRSELYHSDCQQALQSLEATAAGIAHVIGATEAFDRAMFQHFGPFREGLVHEDHALPFRSLLLDRPVVYVPEPLVRYAQGSGVSTVYGGRHPGPAARRLMLGRFLDDVLQRIDDAKKVGRSDILPLLERTADRYRAALAFEESWPSPRALLGWTHRAGLKHVARMIAKRARNQFLDRRCAP